MKKYVLDTCICSYVIKQKPETAKAIAENIVKHEKNKLFITIFNHAELLTGVLLKESLILRKAVESFMERLNVMYFTESASCEYAKIWSELQKRGDILDDRNMLIAACCMAENATLVTHNMKHFSSIKRLNLEDWTMV
ncbi:MAG: type II toxin-antitoxin system VapC family toxin [Puniceicoccales bacterium]|jgi:tRNA(fMet)-specific endonuclease VapC|nr:type II toxin-antitoxin system VapC family toxin [Puniceicoccales bacterium]